MTTDNRKRKRNPQPVQTSLEIDLEAPEPASKKALRKAKRTKAHNAQTVVPVKEGLKDSEVRKDGSQVERKSTRPAMSSKGSRDGIWIGNLPFFVTEEELKRFFLKNLEADKSSASLITRVHLPHAAPKHGKFQNKGFAYVDFDSSDSVTHALKLSESLLGGRRVLIKNAKDFRGRPREDIKNQAESSNRLFIGNLPFDVTAETLQQHFEKCGEISKIHMATFEDSGKCKGYAWIDFKDIMCAENAQRGYIDIQIPSTTALNEHFSADDAETNTVRPAKRRVWVNRLGDRKMRLEFAESPTTRYKKRFGNESRDENGQANDDDRAESLQEKREERTASTPPLASRISEKRQGGNGILRGGDSRYSQHSIEKIRGSIVDSKGTKVKFE